MTSGQWLSDRASGLPVALACGVAGIIAWARPEHGWAAVLDTYGILIGAGVLSGLTGRSRMAVRNITGHYQTARLMEPDSTADGAGQHG